MYNSLAFDDSLEQLTALGDAPHLLLRLYCGGHKSGPAVRTLSLGAVRRALPVESGHITRQAYRGAPQSASSTGSSLRFCYVSLMDSITGLRVQASSVLEPRLTQCSVTYSHRWIFWCDQPPALRRPGGINSSVTPGIFDIRDSPMTWEFQASSISLPKKQGERPGLSLN